MGSAKLTNVLNTYVDQSNPTMNYDFGASFYVKKIAARNGIGYVYFSRPFPLGATITSAKLHMYSYAKPVSGMIRFYATRLKQTVNYGKINWNSRATQFYTDPSETADRPGTYPDREEFVFNITNDMQYVADGDAWYGYQLTTNWTGTNYSPRFMSAQHPNPDLRPWVEITWSDAPDAPSSLAPSGGRIISTDKPVMRFDYTDVSGDTEIQACQVQVTTNNFTTPTYDSGIQLVEGPQWDLTPTALTITPNITWLWRVKVQDGAGLWSGWSASTTFVYKPLPVVEFQNPGEPPLNYVEEPTPPITWTVTEGTQAAYALSIYRRNTGDTAWVPVFARGRTASTTTDGMGVPAGVITVKDATYLANLRIWDGMNREAVPNGPDNILRSREFTYEYSAATSPVTNIEALPRDPIPGVYLEWDRDVAPDSYSISRDGQIIASNLDPDNDTYVDGTHNRWLDRVPVKGKQHSYSVQPIVNGKAAASNPTAYATNKLFGTWLLDADGARTVQLVRDTARTFTMGEQSEVFDVLGATKSVVVTQGQRGYQGEISGEIREGIPGGGTVNNQVTNALNLKSYSGQLIYLFITAMTIPVVLRNVNIYPLPSAERAWAFEAEYYQQDDLNFTNRIG